MCDCLLGKAVASISFSSPAETLLEVIYPDPHKIISKSTVLGKYTYIHTYIHGDMNTLLIASPEC